MYLSRIGGDPKNPLSDGGKFVCGEFVDPKGTFFSLGSRGDYSFERAMIKEFGDDVKFYTVCSYYLLMMIIFF